MTHPLTQAMGIFGPVHLTKALIADAVQFIAMARYMLNRISTRPTISIMFYIFSLGLTQYGFFCVRNHLIFCIK